VLQVFQTMPGVTRATDGSDLYVRGGDPTETPVFVDGARLFYPGTFETLDGGIFGVLDPAVLRRVYFSSGGFSARWGNALSGVLDVETEGRPAGSGWRAGANLASLGGTLRVPLTARSGAWGSATATDASALLWMQNRLDEFEAPPRAFKGVAGMVIEPQDGLEIRATALAESDRTEVIADALGYRGPLHSSGTTRLASVSGRAGRPGEGPAARASLATSERATAFVFGVLDRQRTDRQISLRVEAETGSISRALRAGIEVARLSFRENGFVPATASIGPGAPRAAVSDGAGVTHHAAIFTESETRPHEALALVAGARIDRLPGESRWTMDPRLAVALKLGDWTLRGGSGTFRQGRWRVRYQLPDDGRPSGVPTRARHYTIGAQRDGPVSLRIEAFRKVYDGYAAAGSGPAAVRGAAEGVDVLARWSADAATGWLSYSLLNGELELADGQRVPSPFAVTHTLTAVLRIPVGEQLELGTTTRYATGKPYTPVLGLRDSDDGGTPGPAYGPVNCSV